MFAGEGEGDGDGDGGFSYVYSYIMHLHHLNVNQAIILVTLYVLWQVIITVPQWNLV